MVDMRNVELNRIYHGDNLSFMREFPEAFIDLIYIDPPFGTKSLWSSKAWGKQVQTELKFYDIFGGGKDGYINFIVPRLREMYRLLKPTGSLFVHLDWRMAHYVKIELDKIFGVKNPASSNTNFVNEIIWFYRRWTASSKSLQKMHDSILWYSKTKQYKFYPIYKPPTEGQLKKHAKGWDRNSVMIDGRRQPQLIIYNEQKVNEAIKRGKINKKDYARFVKPKINQTLEDDVWQINFLNSQSKERIGWPTQKPLKLLQRIVKMTTKENDLVADFFCGCGTSIDAAQSLNRKWIGVDAGKTACEVMQKRMEDRHSLFVGIDKKPITLEDFKALEPFDFEKEAVRYIGGIPNESQVADGGIDGVLAFDGTPIQVKKEKEPLGDVDRFRALYEHAKSHSRGVFITLKGFKPKAKQRANKWRREGLDIQLLSIPDILAGKFREQPLKQQSHLSKVS